MLKQELRNKVKELKKQSSKADNLNSSKKVFSTLQRLQVFEQAQKILLYWSLSDELETHWFVDAIFKDKEVYLPVVNGKEVDLVAYTGKNNIKTGAYGILEPQGEPYLNYEEIDLVVVPGIAFTNDGFRLGRGGGYYDRLLPKLTNAKKIGVGYQFQLVGSIPTELHDIKMDRVICL